MNYVIRSFDATFGQITVEFSNADGSATQTFGIDLPVVDGLYPTGSALAEYINSFAPTAAFDRAAAVSGASNADVISALVVPLPVPEPTIPAADGTLPGA